MFNLVKYRYWFLIVSLIVIIPGFIALCIFGLNVGIDFRGGSNISLRPQRQMTTEEADRLLKPFNLESQQVILGENKQLDGTRNVWVRLDTQVDNNVQDSVKKALDAQYNQALHYDISNIQYDGKMVTLFAITGFSNKPQAADIQSALSKLPNTVDLSKQSSTVGATSPTPAATATPKTNSSTSTSNSNQDTTPVKVADVSLGQTSETVNILTLTDVGKANEQGGKASLTKIQEAFLKNGGPYFQVISNSLVGPSVAGTTTTMAFLAVLAASVFILCYIWFAFRKVPKALRYGICAIIALLHDVLVVVGIFSILGKFFNVQIDSLFITGLLTVIGFSVHDTIVVFDRIRENMQRRSNETFEEVVNASLVQTMARSLNTSLTVLFTLLALYLFTGIGTNIHTFTLTLLIGIFSGTYSSIFNASMLLVIWEKGELGLNRFRKQGKVTPARREREMRELARSRG